MTKWTSAELEAAFDHFKATVVQAGATANWDLFADLFTEDATYVEHAFGRFAGREQIRSWITKTMGTFPGNHMPLFPVSWHVVDVERGRIVCEVMNRMADPGDGSVHEAPNITILDYAGDNLFSREEDVYNPMSFAPMVQAWCKRCEELGTLPDDARGFLESAAS